MTPETSTETLAHQLHFTHWVVNQTVADVSDDDALRQAAPNANNLNWILGHITATRNGMLQLAGCDPVLPTEIADRYKRGSEPVAEDPAADLATLLAAFNAAQNRLTEALPALSRDVLTAKAPGSPTQNPDETVGSLLSLLVFHEAYHCGQLGILRRALGYEGVIK